MSDSAEIRFLLDEHIPHSILDGLRRRNIDVTSINELKLNGLRDPDVAATAKEQTRVLVTEDTDFLEVPPPLRDHAGIVFIRDGMSIGSIIRVLTLVHGCSTPEQMHNSIEYGASLE